MFLRIHFFVWIIIVACTFLAFLFAAVCDVCSAKKKDSGRALQGAKYMAITVCALIAIAATVISKYQQYVGAPMAALIIGIVLVNVIPPRILNSAFRSGTAYVGKKYLSFGIVCLGATLSVTDMSKASFSLPLILFNIVLAFLVANLLGKKFFHVSPNTCTLVGGGTCVCGGTAIATLSPIVKATEEETAYAMTAIFLFDLLACLSYPYLAVKLGFNAVQFGFLAGTAINDTSSVVAAQETFAALTGLENYALPATIKVARTTTIIALVIIFSVLSVKKGTRSDQSSSLAQTVWKAVPKFLLFFIAAVVLNTVLVSTSVKDGVFYRQVFSPFFSNGYKFFVTLALAGVGFKIKFKDLFLNGMRPIALGGCTWAALFVSSLTFSVCFANCLMG